MHHLDTVQLSESKSLYLRRNHHIHIQYPPSNISASINLIPKQTITKQAFIFDLDNKKIVDYSIKGRFEGVKSMLIQFNQLL